MNNQAYHGLGEMTDLSSAELEDLGISTTDAMNLYKKGQGAYEKGADVVKTAKGIIDDPKKAFDAAKSAAYAIPVPIPPIPFPIPAGAILDAGEQIFNLGKKAVDWIKGGPQKRRRRRRDNRLYGLALAFYTSLMKAHPHLYHQDFALFKRTLKREIMNPKNYRGGRMLPLAENAPTSDVATWGAWKKSYAPKKGSNWFWKTHHTWMAQGKNRQKFQKAKREVQAEKARIERAKKARLEKKASPEDIKKGWADLAAKRRAADAKQRAEKQKAAAEKPAPTAADWQKLSDAIKKQKKKKKGKKKKQRSKEKKKVREAAKRKDKKIAKALRDKSKKLRAKQKKRTGETMSLKKRARQLRKEKKALEKKLEAAMTETERKSVAKELTKKKDEEEKTQQVNVLGAAMTQNVAAQAAISNEIAKAVEAGDEAKAAILTDAYDRLAALSGKMKDTRQEQLINWGSDSKVRSNRQRFIDRMALRRRHREERRAARAARRAA